MSINIVEVVQTKSDKRLQVMGFVCVATMLLSFMMESFLGWIIFRAPDTLASHFLAVLLFGISMGMLVTILFLGAKGSRKQE